MRDQEHTVPGALDASKDSRLFDVIDNHIISRVIADGATGRVYEARPSDGGERHAIKVLHPWLLTERVSVERFRRECETLSMLNHPQIVKIFSYGTLEGGAENSSPYMVMEYLEGEELSALLERERVLSPAKVLRFACQCALALESAHQIGVIHRDLKPQNIYMCRDGTIKILDFGSAKHQFEFGGKLTVIGTTLGSPSYMSPEQALGKSDLDGRTDLFATCSIVYESLTGKIAFEGVTVGAIMTAILKTEPPPPSLLRPELPQALDDVFFQGWSKEKNERYASVTDFAQALCTAFGLRATVEQVAHTPEEELAQVLKRLMPPPLPKVAPARESSVNLAAPVAMRESSVNAKPYVSERPVISPREVSVRPEESHRPMSKRSLIFFAVLFSVIMIFVAAVIAIFAILT